MRSLVFVALSLSAFACTSTEASPDGSDPAVDDVVTKAGTKAAIRELTCQAETKAETTFLHLRLSADGAIRQGTRMVGQTQAATDKRVDVKSVTTAGDRLRVEASEGDSRYTFTVSVAAFTAPRPTDLDARVEETNDPAIVVAAPPGQPGHFDCRVSILHRDSTESSDDAQLGGADATKLYEALRVTPRDFVGMPTKVVAPDGPTGQFKLNCHAPDPSPYAPHDHGCSLVLPAIVTKVAGGRVSYGYDLDATESKALSSALATGFVGTTFQDPWTNEKVPGTTMALSCTGATCRAEYTAPDGFFRFVGR